ncbi:MAG: heparinase II/III family protein [Clostridiales bacterium]|nr:heparinase II/III family protein [Clostridiales bacterium]
MIILKRLLAALLVVVNLFSCSGLGKFTPHFAVLPDLIKVGIDYISLQTDDNAVSKSTLKKELPRAVAGSEHPYLFVTKEQFATVTAEQKAQTFTPYTNALHQYALQNADDLVTSDSFMPMPYVLDEEDSILPISREVFSRIVILGYAWKTTGDKRYAARAWQELENVCNYPDWCPSHFLATAEMALAVATGFDWLFDYLTPDQKNLLAEKTYTYAIKPALSKNYIKNWFTWSKNNWNSICYSGIGIACMAFADRYPNEAAKFLAMCFRNMPIAFENFTPDGVYIEGPGYADSGMNAIVYFVAAAQNFFGTDFGMSEIDGFRQLGRFPVLITGPAGTFNFGDNKNYSVYSPALHWYASTYKSPLIASYQMLDMPGAYTMNLSNTTERNDAGKRYALSNLWFDRTLDTQSADFSNEPKTVYLKSDCGQNLVLMRGEYADPNATFAGIKGGYNYINHGDLDIGTFVFDALGERWAEELGPGRYDAPDYFVDLPAGGRWKNYCKRAEGQNTLVINPNLTTEDQYALAAGRFTAFSATADGGTCTLDMSEAYRMNGAAKVQRKFTLSEQYSKLEIRDNICCIIPSEVYWFMHTKAEIEISADGKTAILKKNGKQIQATLPPDGDGTFSVMPAVALKGKYEYDDDYTGIQKLTVHLDHVYRAEICVTLRPVT